MNGPGDDVSCKCCIRCEDRVGDEILGGDSEREDVASVALVEDLARVDLVDPAGSGDAA